MYKSNLTRKEMKTLYERNKKLKETLLQKKENTYYYTFRY